MLKSIRKAVQEGIRFLTGWSYMIVPSRSMDPTILPGDIIISEDKFQYYVEGAVDGVYARGDVVTFWDEEDPYNYMVKRIVAVAGDTVTAKHKKLYVNGTPLEEPYLKEPLVYLLPNIEVGAGEVFVLGDNRNNSDDCHFTCRGIKLSRVVGRVEGVWKTRGLLGWIFGRESS